MVDFTIRQLEIIKKSLTGSQYHMVSDTIDIVSKINDMLEIKVDLNATYVNKHNGERFSVLLTNVKHNGEFWILTGEKELINLKDFNKINYEVEMD